MKLNDLTSKTFGNWKVLCKDKTDKNGYAYWLCKCTLCGKEKSVRGATLANGRSTKCRACVPRTALSSGWHGDPIVHIFSGMWQRCYNRNSIRFDLYGGRGITICKEWLKDRATFYKWAYEHGYRKGLSIDRIDNDRGYSPDNCRFVTLAQQSTNRRSVKLITIEGRTMCFSEWCRYVGISRDKARWYIQKNKCSNREAILHFLTNTSI